MVFRRWVKGDLPMKTEIYFVRHAKPDFSIREDEIRPLTKQGLEDSKLVTEFLINKDITRVYSSPFKRAVDTVRDFADRIGLPIIPVADFRERSVGMWVDDFSVFASKQWEDWDYKLENGDSLIETQERNLAALRKILLDNRGESIVIGTHGTALSTLINYYNPNFSLEDFNRIAKIMPWIVCFTFNEETLVTIEEFELL